ncbi:MAG: hypothetical protein ABI471_01475 [Sphingomonas bacterium]
MKRLLATSLAVASLFSSGAALAAARECGVDGEAVAGDGAKLLIWLKPDGKSAGGIRHMMRWEYKADTPTISASLMAVFQPTDQDWPQPLIQMTFVYNYSAPANKPNEVGDVNVTLDDKLVWHRSDMPQDDPLPALSLNDLGGHPRAIRMEYYDFAVAPDQPGDPQRQDFLDSFLQAKTASFSIAKPSGEVLLQRSMKLPDPQEWAALYKKAMAMAVTDGASKRPCLLGPQTLPAIVP